MAKLLVARARQCMQCLNELDMAKMLRVTIKPTKKNNISRLFNIDYPYITIFWLIVKSMDFEITVLMTQIFLSLTILAKIFQRITCWRKLKLKKSVRFMTYHCVTHKFFNFFLFFFVIFIAHC